MEQLQLALETSEIAGAKMIAKLSLFHEEPKGQLKRRPIPDQNPRMEVKLITGNADCHQCSGRLPRLGEDVTEALEYGSDKRPWGSDVLPARWYQFSPDRKGRRPKDHLAKYHGWLHADGRVGSEDLYRSGNIHKVACMAHIQRKFGDIHRVQGSAIADAAIKRIAQLYAIEREARGSPSNTQVAFQQEKAKPNFDDLETLLHIQPPSLSDKSPLAGSIRYALTCLTRLRPYLAHSILEHVDNTAERVMRSIPSGRKEPLVRRITIRRSRHRHRVHPD